MRTTPPTPEESLAAELHAPESILSGETVMVPTCTAIGADAVAALNDLGISLNT